MSLLVCGAQSLTKLLAPYEWYTQFDGVDCLTASSQQDPKQAFQRLLCHLVSAACFYGSWCNANCRSAYSSRVLWDLAMQWSAATALNSFMSGFNSMWLWALRVSCYTTPTIGCNGITACHLLRLVQIQSSLSSCRLWHGWSSSIWAWKSASISVRQRSTMNVSTDYATSISTYWCSTWTSSWFCETLGTRNRGV